MNSIIWFLKAHVWSTWSFLLLYPLCRLWREKMCLTGCSIFSDFFFYSYVYGRRGVTTCISSVLFYCSSKRVILSKAYPLFKLDEVKCKIVYFSSLLFLHSVIALFKFEEPFWYAVYIEDAMDHKVVCSLTYLTMDFIRVLNCINLFVFNISFDNCVP